MPNNHRDKLKTITFIYICRLKKLLSLTRSLSFFRFLHHYHHYFPTTYAHTLNMDIVYACGNTSGSRASAHTPLFPLPHNCRSAKKMAAEKGGGGGGGGGSTASSYITNG